MKSSTKKIFTVLGGFLLHIIVGTVYTMPGISRYFYSYLIQNDSKTFTYKNIESIFSINLGVLSCVVPIGVIFNKYIGVINCSCLGLLLIIGSQAVMIFYPEYQMVQCALIASAVGSSMAYLPVLITIWKYYPKKRGIPTSLCLSGLGLNRLVFKYASLSIINPDKVGLSEKNDCYPADININFIYYMKLLLCFYCILGLVAMLCIFPYDEKEANEESNANKENDQLNESNTNSNTSLDNNEDHDHDNYHDQYAINSTYNHYPNSVSNEGLIVKVNMSSDSNSDDKEIEEPLCSLLISMPFIQLTSMFFCSRIFSTIELSSMKKFGIINGHSVSFVNLSSWVWKFTNFGCFQIWGLLTDKMGFKKVYMSIILIQIAISASFYFIAGNKVTFILCHLLTAAVNSGNITLSPLTYTFIFGIDNGAFLFSLSSMITNTFYICRPLFRTYVNEKISFLIFFLIISLFSMFGLIILCFFDEKRRPKK